MPLPYHRIRCSCRNADRVDMIPRDRRGLEAPQQLAIGHISSWFVDGLQQEKTHRLSVSPGATPDFAIRRTTLDGEHSRYGSGDADCFTAGAADRTSLDASSTRIESGCDAVD